MAAQTLSRFWQSPWLLVVGIIAALDLSTGLHPSFIDVFGAAETFPGWVRALEGLIALSALPALFYHLRLLAPRLRDLPGSSPVKAIMALYLVGSLVAVFFRTEFFPFSNVGMFSAVPEFVDAQTPRREGAIVFVRGEEILPIAVLREGNALVGTVSKGWDYKMGWAMKMYGTSDTRALQLANQLAQQHQYERVARAIVVFDPRNGKTLAVEPYRKLKP